MSKCILMQNGSPEGNATPSDVLNGKTFSNSDGEQVGTMPNRGAINATISAGGNYTIPQGYHNGNGKVSASAKSFDTMLIATSNSNSVKKSGRSGGEASVETSCTFTASYIGAIIACGSSVNDDGGTDGLNSNQPRAYVYATKEGSTSEVQCTWNSTRKCYEVPDKNVKYTKVRASNYGFSGSSMVHAMIGCLYVFGN